MKIQPPDIAVYFDEKESANLQKILDEVEPETGYVTYCITVNVNSQIDPNTYISLIVDEKTYPISEVVDVEAEEADTTNESIEPAASS